MDYDNLQFVSVVNKLADELRAIADGLQQQNEAIKEQTRANQDAQYTQRRVIAELKTTQAEKYRKETDTTKESFIKWGTLYAEAIGILVVIAYTTVSFFQLREIMKQYPEIQRSSKAADSAAHTAAQTLASQQQSFRDDRRPYVYPTPQGVFPTSDGKLAIFLTEQNGDVSVGVRVAMENTGRSPAIEVVSTKTEFKIGPVKDVEEWAGSYVPYYEPANGGTSISPNSTVVPRSDTQRITKADYDAWKNGTFEMLIVGGVQYRDIFTPRIKPYETTYFYRANTVGLPFANASFKTKGKFSSFMK
jgi:hypothetical protein